jgi:hypothetical protein
MIRNKYVANMFALGFISVPTKSFHIFVNSLHQ